MENHKSLIGKKDYSFFVCGATVLQQLMSVGMVCSAFSAYLPYVSSAFQFTNAQTSLIITMRSLSILATLAFIDQLIEKLGVRKVLLLSDILAVLGFIAFSRATKITDFYLGAVFIGACNGFGGMATVTVLINKWFVTNKSTALGVSSVGSSIAIMAMPTLTTLLVESVGLSRTFLLEAIFIALSSVLIFIMVHDTPEEISAQAYNKPGKNQEKTSTSKAHVTLTRGQYMLVIIAVGSLGASGNVIGFLTMLYAGNGYSASMTSYILSAVGIVLIFGKVVFGRISDKIGAFRSCTIFSVLMILGTIFSALSFSQNWILLVLAVLCNGFGWSMASLGLSIMAEMFGSEAEYDHLAARFTLAYSVGFLVFSYGMGYLADLSGGYVIPFYVCALLCAISLIMRNAIYSRAQR